SSSATASSSASIERRTPSCDRELTSARSQARPPAPLDDGCSSRRGRRAAADRRARAAPARHARPMRRLALVLTLLALLALAPAAGASDHGGAVVGQLPELGRVARGRTRVVIRGEVSRPAARDAIALVEQVIGDVQRRFAAAAEAPDRDITLCLLPDRARFRA